MTGQISKLGLIGKPLSHSFSKSYFSKKFEKEGIENYQYDLYELQSIHEFRPLIAQNTDLVGLNVTIPYKQQVIPFMNRLSKEAKSIGAVNVIKIKSGKLQGFNSDYYGFKTSLQNWIPPGWKGRALILGTGGASLAVKAVLDDLNIPFIPISRGSGVDRFTYEQVKNLDLLNSHKLIINTTPLGMVPNTTTAPDIEYQHLGPDHLLYDLVYNPETTRFMSLGLEQGAKVKNGLEMLELQAEKSWEIWTTR